MTKQTPLNIGKEFNLQASLQSRTALRFRYNCGKFMSGKHVLRTVYALIRGGQPLMPITIQLTRPTGGARQEVALGIDAGFKQCTDINKLIAQRCSRRSRKTRHRALRFDNRVHGKHKGWLAPSVEHRINTHLRQAEKVLAILPVSSIVVEAASFDIQKIMNPDIKGVGH